MLQVARTSTGAYVSSRLAGDSSRERAQQEDEEEEAAGESLEVDELLCVTVDACGRAASGFMNAHFRYRASIAAAAEGNDADGDGCDDDDEAEREEQPYTAEVCSPS